MAARMSGDARAVRAWQQATARWRPLPDFVIFGASKAGTTSMYDYLGAHPLVVPCRAKELHFADRLHNAARGAKWYRSWFPLRATLARVGRAGGVSRARCGEATPSYLAMGGSARRLHGVAPDVRLVALLREPGERAWSHYRMTEPRRDRMSTGSWPRSRPRPRSWPTAGARHWTATRCSADCCARATTPTSFASGTSASRPTRSCSCAARICSPIPRPPTARCAATSGCPTVRRRAFRVSNAGRPFDLPPTRAGLARRVLRRTERRAGRDDRRGHPLAVSGQVAMRCRHRRSRGAHYPRTVTRGRTATVLTTTFDDGRAVAPARRAGGRGADDHPPRRPPGGHHHAHARATTSSWPSGFCFTDGLLAGAAGAHLSLLRRPARRSTPSSTWSRSTPAASLPCPRRGSG